MKSVLKISLNVAILGTIIFSGCKKYEEGPMISLRTKKARMINEWKLEKSIDGQTGTETTCNSNCTVMEFKEDGTIVVNGVSWSGVKWEFSDDKEKLAFITTIGSITTTSYSTILRLKNDELWLKDDSDGDEDHYVSN